jgi:hypothetical protein
MSDDSSISGNTANVVNPSDNYISDIGGGGVFGDVVMKDRTAIKNNKVFNGYVSYAYGGGVCGGITMSDSAEISGNTGTEDGGVSITSSKTFLMEGNAVIKNNAGGGVAVAYDSTFTMKDFTSVRDNTGGGVSVSGTFIMRNNAAVSYNTADFGGGVFIGFCGNFTMRDNAVISDNTAAKGGGVLLQRAYLTPFEPSIFIMRENAAVKGNTATDQGGGVFINYASDFPAVSYLYQSGGVIYGSTEEDASLRNTAPEGAALYKENTTYCKAEYGSFGGDTWVKAGDILPYALI